MSAQVISFASFSAKAPANDAPERSLLSPKHETALFVIAQWSGHTAAELVRRALEGDLDALSDVPSTELREVEEILSTHGVAL